MAKERRSFFERLIGSVKLEETNENSPASLREENTTYQYQPKSPSSAASTQWVETPEEGELSVDAYQTDKEIIIEAMVAGVKPDDLQLNISRDTVTIKGKREPNTEVQEEDYVVKELFWGGFSRTIHLPFEIVIEEAEAVEKHGLLILRLPKVDKNREAKIRVKSI